VRKPRAFTITKYLEKWLIKHLGFGKIPVQFLKEKMHKELHRSFWEKLLEGCL
jgi:hypothetical protein